MKWVFTGMAVLAVLFGIVNRRMPQVTSGVVSGATDAVTLAITLTGGICLWSGVMRVAQAAGITRMIARLFAPVLRRVFRDPSDDAAEAMSMNIAANMLGLGNAATPLGITAMRELQKQNSSDTAASHNMILFTVFNSASLQIIPTSIATLRIAHGSAAPMQILPPLLLTSFGSLVLSVLAAKLFAFAMGDRHV